MIRLIFISLLIILTSYPQTDYSCEISKINELLKDDFFISSGISISIFDLTGNRLVYEKESKKLLRPASNMKILTSTAGLLFLGGDYSFSTSLWYTGLITNNILYGDLYIKGGCDPDFTSSDIDSLIDPMISSGIKEISGSIYLDISMKDSVFWGNGWMWDDDPSTDAPYLSALNINDNAIKVLIKPGISPGYALIKTQPQTGYVNILNNTVTGGAGESVTITRNWINRTNDIIASGTVSPSDSEYAVVLNIFNPEEYFSTLFLERLREKGVKFANTSGISGFSRLPERGLKLASVERTYDTVLVNLNKTSDNLSAEMVLYALSEKFYGRPASAKGGLKMIDSLIILAGGNPADYILADGSGVSHYNLISTELINNILKYLYFQNHELFTKLYNSFPSAGKDGTLSTRMKGTSSEDNVHAKTGTLSGVSSLSGYLTTPKKDMFSFSIMIQNYKGSASTARYFQDAVCNILTGS